MSIYNELLVPLAPDNTVSTNSCQNYGLEFVDASSQQIDKFETYAAKLIDARLALQQNISSLNIPLTTAAYFRPEAFLANPLTRSQRLAINSNETPPIAEYCVGIQAQLKKVPLIESYEPMRHLPSLLSSLGVEVTFSDLPFHESCGEWAGKQRQYWVRDSFAHRLYAFGSILNTIGVDLHFEDAFRPVGVQEGLFKRRMQWTVNDHPDWPTDQLLKETQSKTATTPRLASHKAGAAVDARIRDHKTGNLLDFGHNYPDGGAIVYPKTPFITHQQWLNRQLFQVAAGLCDLALYVGEDWHVSFGDNLAALNSKAEIREGYTAQYGPIRSFEYENGSGEIKEVYARDELDQSFSL